MEMFREKKNNKRKKTAGEIWIGYKNEATRKKQTKRLWKGLINLLSGAIIILGLSYASVPLYQIFCQTTGFSGQTQKALKLEMENIHEPQGTINPFSASDKEKQIIINFNADVSSSMQNKWSFKPSIENQKIKIYPGDTALTFYIAENLTKETITGISTYHVTPAKVGIYFNKIQCFCFEEQQLKGHERIEMPVLFFLDPEFTKDPKMEDVDKITLSYTFFRQN